MSGASNWKIADTLFYPLGLFNNSSKSKVVFVVWTFNCLYTYIFKKTGETSSLKDTYKIVINQTIEDIIVTEYNTLVLMRNGQVYYFSSCRNLKRLKFLSGVRCMTPTKDGFALIRVNENKSILLETFKDFSDAGEVESGRTTFDISFDETNILKSSWKDEKFSLFAVQVDEKNKEFFDLVARRTVASNEIYFFTISNNLFCLLPNQTEQADDNYEISLIVTMPSQIENVKLAVRSITALLVFMSCGAIEIIFYSQLSQLLDRVIHVTGPDVIASTFANDCFYYSDGENVVKTEFTYNNTEHTCVVQEHTKHLPNIVALTWTRSIQMLVCLSENNIFYRTKFMKSVTPSTDADEYYELTDKKLKENEQNLSQIVELVDEPNKIYRQIENEVHKQEVIAIAERKRIYAKLVSAVVSFYSAIPEIKQATFILNGDTLSQKDHYFVVISFNIVWNEMFRAGLWNLIINFSSTVNSCWTLKIHKTIIANEFHVLIPVRKEKFVIPPHIWIELASFINVDRDFVYVALPANFKNYNFHNLFTAKPTSMEFNKPKLNKLDKMLFDLAERNNPFGECEISKKKFCVKIRTPLIMSACDLYEMFNVQREQYKDVIEDIELYFLREKLIIKYVELENYIQIETEDPVALFYTKLVITKGLSSEYYDDEPVNVQAAERQLIEIQCEVEGRYGSGYSEEAYAASLRRLYTKLRHNIIKQF